MLFRLCIIYDSKDEGGTWRIMDGLRYTENYRIDRGSEDIAKSKIASTLRGHLIGSDITAARKMFASFGFFESREGGLLVFTSDEAFPTYIRTETVKGRYFMDRDEERTYYGFDSKSLSQMESFLETLIPAAEKLPSSKKTEVDDLKEQVAKLQEMMIKMMSEKKGQDRSRSPSPTFYR